MPSIEYLTAQFTERARAERLGFGPIESFATPRRLAIRVSDVDKSTPELRETRMGPAARIAFDADGNPTKAAQGFARGAKVDVSQLQRVETPKGEYIAAEVVQPGKPAAEVIAPIVTAILGSIPWPKPMRWGWEPTGWGRPIHWIVALLDGEVLPLEFAGVNSDRNSWGHRFLKNEPLNIASAADYEAVMAEAKVVPSISGRSDQIMAAAQAAVAPHRLVEDADLLAEVVQLVELPQVGVGEFDPSFLELPREVLISEMKEHQRYFAVEDDNGNLVNRFVVVYNTPVRDPNVVLQGNRRVLVARLTDGAFFLRRDKQRSLESRVEDLSQVVFLKQLGTVRQKVERIERLAGELGPLLFPEAADDARRAALLAKADLTSDMVGEFPELQGTMGRYYAIHDGENEAVAHAVEEHYRPKGANDQVPSSEAGIIVSIADKMDTLAGCFAIGMQPTGAADPYGLRRAALGVIRIALEHKLRFSLGDLIRTAIAGIGEAATEEADAVQRALDRFFKARLKAWLSNDAATDVIDAVVSAGIDDLPAVTAKVAALAQMRDNADFEPLAVAFKRVSNILKKGAPDLAAAPDRFEHDAERGLWQTYGETKNTVDQALQDRDFSTAVGALIELKAPVDQFFEDVLVMAENEDVRNNRLALLRDLRTLFHSVADISRIKVDG